MCKNFEFIIKILNYIKQYEMSNEKNEMLNICYPI